MQMTETPERTKEQNHNYSLIRDIPFKLIVQAKLNEKPSGLEVSKVFSMCVADLIAAEGKNELILLHKSSQDFELKEKHNQAIKKINEQCPSEEDKVALNDRLGPCDKWPYFTGVKLREDPISGFGKVGFSEDALDSKDKKQYLLIGTAESFHKKKYDEVKILVPINKADELFDYEQNKQNKKQTLMGLNKSEKEDYEFFRECIDTETIDGQAFCKQTTARIYGTKSESKNDLNIATICHGARIRTAILAQTKDISTSITSLEPTKEYTDINQQQVCLISFSRKRFQQLFGILDSLLANYSNETAPTILNNIPMKYN